MAERPWCWLPVATGRSCPALETLRRTGWGRLLQDSFRRFRYADGFRHSRALAFAAQLEAVRAGVAAPITGEQTNAPRSREELAHQRDAQDVLGTWR